MKRRRQGGRGVAPRTNIFRGRGAWVVRVMRGRQNHCGHFADAVYGGERQAHIAARHFRDHLLRRIEPDARVRKKVPRGSRSETHQVGVNFEEYVVGGRSHERFIAHWKDADGRPKRRRFAVGRYGRVGALALAVEARNEGVAQSRAVRRAREREEALERIATAPPKPRPLKDPKSRKGMRMPSRNRVTAPGRSAQPSSRTSLVRGP